MWSEAGIYLQQKGLLCDRKGEHANVTPLTQEAPLMRLSVASLRRVVKGDLRIEFVRQDLTSYGGLELLRRYVRQLGMNARLRTACAAVGGDYGGARPAPPVISPFFVGGRPPGQPLHPAGGPLITSFLGL